MNFLVPFLNDRVVVTGAAERAQVIEFFWGDPDAGLVAQVHAAGALASWQVGSVSEAVAAADAGCDLVIAQGVEAGGHVRGTTPLLELLPAVVGAVAVPVLASGGIGTAHDLVAALAAGAVAARVGTRFLATEESAAHPDYIARLLAARADDTVLTEAFGHGWPQAPHRVLRSCVDAAEALPDDDVAQVRRGVQSAPVPRWSSMPPTRAVHGHVAATAHYAGLSVDAVRAVAPAETVVRELTALLD